MMVGRHAARLPRDETNTHSHTTQTPSKMSAAPGSAVARLSPGPLSTGPQLQVRGQARGQARGLARPLTRLREGFRLHVADSNP